MAVLKRKKILARAKRTLRHMTPQHLVKSQMTAGVIRRFADKVGLVYFGTIHRNDEDYRLIRGHTVSHSQLDRHYAVGSIRGYDVAMVLRNDVVLTKHEHKHKEERCHWLIITVDLHTKQDIPHFYVGHRNRDGVYRASFERLVPLYIGGLAPYPRAFLDAYTVYGRATHTLSIETVMTPQIAMVINEHFDGASIEVEDNTVYMYLESARPTEAQLDKLLANGLWLAESIDLNSESLYCEVPFASQAIKKEP